MLKTSAWPTLRRWFTCSLLTSFVVFFKWGSWERSFISLIFLCVCLFCWWKDISREGRRGEYSPLVVDGLKGGMLLFIFREVCFFASFFWCFFHNSLRPDIQIGQVWPPVALKVFSPFQIPLLNTLILLSRGVTITWSHHSLVGSKNFFNSLLMTILLGGYFSFLQGFEYFRSFFTIRDRIYGAVFFIATGFHGIHVIVGSIFLLICLFRSRGFNNISLLGFELAAWYWHFVDVVWIFLFSFLYWWGCSEYFFWFEVKYCPRLFWGQKYFKYFLIAIKRFCSNYFF